MRLSDIRAGMECSALSVVRGTAISEFRVDIIDVLRGNSESIGARILFRASGPAVDGTGLGPGFSGSPIYCPDGRGTSRVVGAVSESVGQYGNYVALATPIEDILGVAARAPRRARKASALLRSAKPLATPLTVSGLSSTVRRAVLAGARRAGFPLLATPAAPATPYPPYPLVPGSSVAVGLSSGDIALGAIGTVAYRDGDRLWAFGHMLEGVGHRALPLLDAYVFSVIDNPLGTFEASTYKLAAPGRLVGTLTNDGISAVAGRVGALPSMIPLSVFARDLGSGRTQRIAIDVADERHLDLGAGLSLMGDLATYEAMVSVLGAEPPEVTTSVCLKVRARQTRAPLGFCKRYFDAWQMSGDIFSALNMVESYEAGPLDIEGVSVRMGVRAGVRDASIIRAKALRRVRAGQRIRVRLTLQRPRSGRFKHAFPYRVPRSTRPGRRVLTIRGTGPSGGADGLEEIFALLFGEEGGGGRAPKSLPELRLRIAALGIPEGVRATFARKGKGRIVYRNDRLRIGGKARIPIVVKGRKRARGPLDPTPVAVTD